MEINEMARKDYHHICHLFINSFVNNGVLEIIHILIINLCSILYFDDTEWTGYAPIAKGFVNYFP